MRAKPVAGQLWKERLGSQYVFITHIDRYDYYAFISFEYIALKNAPARKTLLYFLDNYERITNDR
jgi:hypothetical protein